MPTDETADLDAKRVSRGTAKCGWCLTDAHSKCRIEIEYYGRKWPCPCPCPKRRKK